MNILVGEEEIVDMLIKNGADTNVENSDGNTPITLAVNGGNSYVIVVTKWSLYLKWWLL